LTEIPNEVCELKNKSLRTSDFKNDLCGMY